MEDGNVPVALSGDELISKVESQLFNAVGLLQAYQEGKGACIYYSLYTH